MKKNGRRFRRVQKEKERKKAGSIVRTCICQEVDDINTAYLAMSHIIVHNPIISDTRENRREYLKRLNSYVKAGGWNRRKYESAQLAAYEKIICDSREPENEHDISFYRYYILFDLMHILAYEFKPADEEKMIKVKERYNNDFGGCAERNIVNDIFKVFINRRKRMKQLIKNPGLIEEKQYIQLIEKNNSFKIQEPFGVAVTATMSAGKSTFINALAGKYVCLSQNMACTSKIHCIVNKAFEDGYSAEYDYDLVLTAGKEELMNDNEKNSSDKIVVSTRFQGGLADQRIVVNDSPGVNFSGDEEHKQITSGMVRRKNYNLLIYVMNATQLATNDESEHLDFIKTIVKRTPVMFVINKIDTFNVEEENLEAAIRRQVKMLEEKGFKNPMVCPVSAKAGYLAKRYASDSLSRSEERELYNYVDKFEQMNLKKYYAGTFKNVKVKDAEREEEQLIKTCGLAYVEKIITDMIKGGNTNGTGTR